MEELPPGFFVGSKPKAIELPDPGNLKLKIPLNRTSAAHVTFENVSASFVEEALSILNKAKETVKQPFDLDFTTSTTPSPTTSSESVIKVAVTTTSPTMSTSTTTTTAAPGSLPRAANPSDTIKKIHEWVSGQLYGENKAGAEPGDHQGFMPEESDKPVLGASVAAGSDSTLSILLAAGLAVLMLVALDRFLTQVYRISCRNTLFSQHTGELLCC